MLDSAAAIDVRVLDQVCGGYGPADIASACRASGEAARQNEVNMLLDWKRLADQVGRSDGPDGHPNLNGPSTKLAYADGCITGAAKRLFGR